MDNLAFDQQLEWSVFVGGIEVNDYLLPLQDAQNLAGDYRELGYDDVAIVQNSPTARLRNSILRDIYELGRE